MHERYPLLARRARQQCGPVLVDEIGELGVLLGALDVGVGGGVDQYAAGARSEPGGEVGHAVAHGDRVGDVELALGGRHEGGAPLG